jgi:hypothetical protein
LLYVGNKGSDEDHIRARVGYPSPVTLVSGAGSGALFFADQQRLEALRSAIPESLFHSPISDPFTVDFSRGRQNESRGTIQKHKPSPRARRPQDEISRPASSPEIRPT